LPRKLARECDDEATAARAQNPRSPAARAESPALRAPHRSAFTNAFKPARRLP
jgi:hypothetical protein